MEWVWENCSLWTGSKLESVVVKHVKLPKHRNHPLALTSDISHERNIKSYEVETAWYENWGSLCDDNCRIPKCLALYSHGEEVLIVLEDLDSSGYPARKRSLSWVEIEECIKWLASFHAKFLGKTAEDLWEIGTYWHLATRQEELEALDDIKLKNAAKGTYLHRRKSDGEYNGQSRQVAQRVSSH